MIEYIPPVEIKFCDGDIMYVDSDMDGGIELTLDVVNYGCCSTSTDERYFYIDKKNAQLLIDALTKLLKKDKDNA